MKKTDRLPPRKPVFFLQNFYDSQVRIADKLKVVRLSEENACRIDMLFSPFFLLKGSFFGKVLIFTGGFIYD